MNATAEAASAALARGALRLIFGSLSTKENVPLRGRAARGVGVAGPLLGPAGARARAAEAGRRADGGEWRGGDGKWRGERRGGDAKWRGERRGESGGGGGAPVLRGWFGPKKNLGIFLLCWLLKNGASAPGAVVSVRGRREGDAEWVSYRGGAHEAARILGLNHGNISQACRLGHKVQGYVFELDEPTEPPLLDGEVWMEVTEAVLEDARMK